MRDANPRASVPRGASHRAKVSLLTGLIAATAVCLVVPPRGACAQQSYSDYYRNTLRQTGGGLGTASSSRYLYDKYYYHRPTVSPYMNLNRPDPLGSTSYQAYVRPELQRRETAMKTQSAYIQQRKLQGNVGDTRYPGAGFVGGTPADAWHKPLPPPKATPSVYYNHWYGGR
jgi:hypothetical protein